MNYLLRIGVLCALFIPSITLAAESIPQFDAVYTVHANGQVEVTETIVYDFGANERHGMFRVLSTEPPQPASKWYKSRFVTIDIESVQRDGEREPYTVTESGDAVRIKIGDADRTLTGRHTYTLSYTLIGALSFGPDGTELYWNATGDQWEVPIDMARVTLVDTGSLFLSARACYVGVVGDTSTCTITDTEGGVVFSASELLPGEQLTVAHALDPERVRATSEERLNLLLVPIAGSLLIVGLSVWWYRFRTAFKPNRPIIAEYAPYEELNPMYTGLLIDGTLNPRDITAGILTLAERGHLRITRTESKALLVFTVTDYEIELVKQVGAETLSYELATLELLGLKDAALGTTVSLRDIAQNSAQQQRNYKTLTRLKRELAERLIEEGYYERRFVFRRRTKKGYDARFHLLGFKEFLSVTDTERFAFHNAPDKSPELFLEYLPYAIAFGVEKEWAAVFKDISIPNPEWYGGGASVAAFSATDFTESMSALSSTLASTGSTGSSGGGSVGGGGGGGGGGSW